MREKLLPYGRKCKKNGWLGSAPHRAVLPIKQKSGGCAAAP